MFSSPALGDIDNDGLPDIVVGCNDGKIYAWQGDGSQIFAITAQTQGGDDDWVDTLWPGDHYEGSHVDRLDPDGTWRYLVRNQVSGTTVENLEPFTLRLEIEGTQISAYVNDVLIHSFTDPYDDPPDGGYVGLYAEHVYYGTGFMEDRHKANCHFDNLIVTAK